MRHLLTHASGISGDVFHRYRPRRRLPGAVRRPAQGRRAEPPAGRDLLALQLGLHRGRSVIEKLTGKSWDTALREPPLTPLGLDHTVTLPEEALPHRAAVGHRSSGDGEPGPAPVWVLPRSMGPAGLVTAPAEDVWPSPGGI
ncbi:serine hydrolase [Streptomyces sp. NPDC003393]